MKKLSTLIITCSLLANINFAQAMESSTIEKIKEYGIPCAVSVLAGFVLADKVKNGAAVGVAVCGGISAHTYLEAKKVKEPLSKEDQAKINKMVADSMDRLGIEKDKKLDERVAKLEDQQKKHAEELEIAQRKHAEELEASQKKQIDEMRNILREVLADKMIQMEDSMKASLQKQLESGELMPKLEANLKEMIKKEVVTESKVRQPEIVSKAVEQTIKEVIAKPVGVQENQTGIQENP